MENGKEIAANQIDKHKKQTQGAKNKHKGIEGKSDKKKWQSVPKMTGWEKGRKRGKRGRRAADGQPEKCFIAAIILSDK